MVFSIILLRNPAENNGDARRWSQIPRMHSGCMRQFSRRRDSLPRQAGDVADDGGDGGFSMKVESDLFELSVQM